MRHIKNKEDFEMALKRLDEIWGARPGDDEVEERAALIDMIVEYEDEHVHIPPPTEEEARAFREDQERD